MTKTFNDDKGECQKEQKLKGRMAKRAIDKKVVWQKSSNDKKSEKRVN